MLSTRIKAQVVAFIIVALVGTSYLGARYVGINLVGSGYDVTLSLPDGGGSFINGEVTYRGVPVGRISKLHATNTGAEATLHIEGSAPAIPADSTATVNDRSAIGEQYIDLSSDSTSGPKLRDGDHLEATAESLPPSIDKLLRTGRDFLDSVPSEDLDTIIDESYAATQGNAMHLASLLDTSAKYANTATENFLVTAGLIENSAKVLNTQQSVSSDILGYSRDLKLIASTMRDSDRNLRTLIDHTPAATKEINTLFTEVGAPLGTLMGNLVSTAQIFGIYSGGVQDAMIRLPEAMSIGFAINGSQGADLGLTTTFFDPLPCTTGYAATQVRPGLDTSAGEPLNLGAGCGLSPASGTNVRGPNAALAGVKHVRVAADLDDLFGGH